MRGARRLNTPWHEPAKPGDCEALAGSLVGSWGLMSLAAKECIVIPPLEEEGPLDALAKERARQAFMDKRHDHGTHEVHPRLLRVLQRAVREFEVPYIHLISGFRPGRKASRHAHGLAADVVFPGVTNRQLARFMRKQGFMGVGMYMRTGFVHVDVRERSYFWLDWSPPGKKWRGKPILMAEARAADEAALERGDAPFAAPDELQRALDARHARRAKVRAARKRRHAEAKQRRAKARRRAAARRRAEARRAAQAERRQESTATLTSAGP